MSQPEAVTGSLDRIFDALRHRHRRRILSLVAEANPDDEAEFSPNDIPGDEEDAKLQTLVLYHTHLPKLAEAGYIEWDRDTRAIRRGPQFDEVEPLIRLMRDHQDELPSGWP